jgi:hypothetical protein
LLGFLYWYGLYPIHALMFRGLVLAVAKHAETMAAERLAEAMPVGAVESDAA